MGIVNVTPDSFSDGGKLQDVESAVAWGLRLESEGADLVDIGGESTRPGARPVSVEEELARVLPVIRGLRARTALPLSIDTSKPQVIREAVAAGVDMVNDVYALRAPGALETVAELGVPVALMHMQGAPRTMQHRPKYRDVVLEVRRFLSARAEACASIGIPRAQIVIDPGFGFGKTLPHNLRLLKHLGVLAETGYPVLVGVSRKSMIEGMIGRPVESRVHASVALALESWRRGAAIVRVHDVAATVDALRVIARVETCA